MPRLCKGLIFHGIRTYSGTEEAELTSLAVNAKQKCGGLTSHLGE